MATLDQLCDGMNDCSGGQDEVGIICESKLYNACRLAIRNVDLYCAYACCMHCHSAFTIIMQPCIRNYYILQTSAASLTTETAISHENVSLLCLVKTAGTVCLG